MMSKNPATIWRRGTVKVKRGFRMANLGKTAGPKTLPTLRLALWLLMTLPPFISLPVPTIVRTPPTGMVRQEGSSKRTKYFSHGSSSHQAETLTALA